jgi:hypothetical protein
MLLLLNDFLNSKHATAVLQNECPVAQLKVATPGSISLFLCRPNGRDVGRQLDVGRLQRRNHAPRCGALCKTVHNTLARCVHVRS